MDKNPIGEPIFMDGEQIGFVNVESSWDVLKFVEMDGEKVVIKARFKTVSWPSYTKLFLDALEHMEVRREQED